VAVLTNVGEEHHLRWQRDPADTALVVPVPPYLVSLLTVQGSDTAAGTEATGAGYARQQYPLSVPAADTDGDFFMDNTATMRYDNLDAQTIVGVDVYDSAATPVRWAHGPLAANVAVAAGAPFEFAVGDLKWKFR
jgi:hypothetical protein